MCGSDGWVEADRPRFSSRPMWRSFEAARPKPKFHWLTASAAHNGRRQVHRQVRGGGSGFKTVNPVTEAESRRGQTGRTMLHTPRLFVRRHRLRGPPAGSHQCQGDGGRAHGRSSWEERGGSGETDLLLGSRARSILPRLLVPLRRPAATRWRWCPGCVRVSAICARRPERQGSCAWELNGAAGSFGGRPTAVEGLPG